MKRQRRKVMAAVSVEHRLRRLAILIVLVPIPVVALIGWATYDNAVSNAHRRLQNTTNIAYAYTVTTFQTYDFAVAEAQRLVSGLGDAEIRAREVELHERLAALARSLPQIDTIFVLDRRGHPLVGAKVLPVPPGLDLSDRPFFTAHRDGLVPAGGDYIGPVTMGRARRVKAFQVSIARQPLAPGDGFSGVVVVSANLPYLRHVFREMTTAAGATNILLFRDDGPILARYPQINQTAISPRNLAFIKAHPGDGFIAGRSVSDNVSRIGIYKRLPDRPVYVIAGIDQSVVVDEWLRGMAVVLLLWTAAMMALLGLCLIALRRARNEMAALVSLNAETVRRQETEAQLRQAQKMEMVGQLTGGIAHDFNNLLTGISGALEIMEKRIAGDQLATLPRYAALARDSVRRAAALTHRLLSFSRRQVLDPKPTDVDGLVAGIGELIRRTIGPSVTLDIRRSPDRCTTLVDPHQLENALLNLCINARDAMPDGGRITIATANVAPGDPGWQADHAGGRPYVRLDVTDTGTGMAPEVVAQVFEPFFTTKPAGTGTGLGLAMVQSFANQSGGQVLIRSEIGAGTTISICLPSIIAPAAEPEIAAAASEPVRAEPGEVVLLVDDEPTVRQLAAEALVQRGYAVIQAADAESALAAARPEARLDILVADVGLRGPQGGQWLADRLRLQHPALRVLFISGSKQVAAETPDEDGETPVLRKPFTLDALTAAVHGLRQDG